MVWEWYRERRQVISAARPNAAHHALVDLQRLSREFLLITQNVDDLDVRAGMPSDRLVQIHGRIFDTRCDLCSYHVGQGQIETNPVPICTGCGSKLRPGVVWFDEELPAKEVARIEAYLDRGPCDLVLVVGTSGRFDYVVDWAARAKGDHGRLIEVNPKPSGLTHLADAHIRGRASLALPAVAASLGSSQRYSYQSNAEGILAWISTRWNSPNT